MANSPVIEWRASTTPFATVTSVPMVGSGYNGAIPIGTASTLVTLRLYNNFIGTAGIADATNCIIACYDDTVHQGTAVNPSTIGQYVSVNVSNYNGSATTGSDGTNYYSIGGTVKHPIPTNGGSIGGSASNYITVNLIVNVPPDATQGTVSQGIWLEYSSTS